MKNLIIKNPILSFVIVTFLYSWTLWLLMILSSKGMLPFRFPTNFLGSFGPAIGAITIILISEGKRGLKELVRKIFLLQTNIWNYLFALLFIVAATLISLLIFLIFNNSELEFGRIDSWVNPVLYFIIILFVGGPLGEELGWRGFLQPQLHKRFNPFVASLIISAIWILWHLPLFWLEGAAQKGGSILNFTILVVCMSFLFTWLYLRTNGSLMLALLFHTSVNFFTAYLIPILLPFTSANHLFNLISTLTIIGLTFTIVLFSKNKFMVLEKN